MTTLRFVFDDEKLNQFGYTADGFLKPMREFAEEHSITEVEYGFFKKSGEDAMTLLTDIVVLMTYDNPDILNCLKKWEVNVDGEIEDSLEISKQWIAKHGCGKGYYETKKTAHI